MNTFKNDYDLGKANEIIVLQKLKDFFKDDTITQTKNMYCKYDYESKDAIYELKTRNNRLLAYPTTLIGFDKILNTTKIQYFVYSYIDKLAYIKYDKDLFSTFQLLPFKRNARDDFIDKEKLYYHIPVKNLIIIDRKCLVII